MKLLFFAFPLSYLLPHLLENQRGIAHLYRLCTPFSVHGSPAIFILENVDTLIPMPAGLTCKWHGPNILSNVDPYHGCEFPAIEASPQQTRTAGHLLHTQLKSLHRSDRSLVFSEKCGFYFSVDPDQRQVEKGGMVKENLSKGRKTSHTKLSSKSNGNRRGRWKGSN